MEKRDTNTSMRKNKINTKMFYFYRRTNVSQATKFEPTGTELIFPGSTAIWTNNTYIIFHVKFLELGISAGNGSS